MRVDGKESLNRDNRELSTVNHVNVENTVLASSNL